MNMHFVILMLCGKLIHRNLPSKSITVTWKTCYLREMETTGCLGKAKGLQNRLLRNLGPWLRNWPYARLGTRSWFRDKYWAQCNGIEREAEIWGSLGEISREDWLEFCKNQNL